MNHNLLARCNQANQMIRSINLQGTPPRDPGMFRFPGEDIMGMIGFIYDNIVVSTALNAQSTTEATADRHTVGKYIAYTILSIRQKIGPLGHCPGKVL